MIKADELHLECQWLQRHQSLLDFFAHLKRFVDRMGFFQYLYTALPASCRFPLEQPYVFNTSYDGSWMQYYTDQAYFQNDSALKHCLSGKPEAYVWQRSFITKELLPSEQKVFREANEAGIRYGFSLPMLNSIGALGVLSCSFDGRDDEFDAFYLSRRQAIETFAYAFNETIIEKFAPHFGQRHLPRLTAKEVEVMKWLCAGYTYEQIAGKLIIGSSTIRKHISNIISKLNANNSTHACVLALRWKLV